jgi:hypothetical protein
MGIVCIWSIHDLSVLCVMCVVCLVFVCVVWRCVWFVFLHSVDGFGVGYVFIYIQLFIYFSSSHCNCLLDADTSIVFDVVQLGE